VLAAVREIHDGRWVRNVGTDGGRSLKWTGRIVVVAAVTSAWDAAHGVIAQMGDRFVLVRADSRTARGEEERMRKELAQAIGGLIGSAKTCANSTTTRPTS
jgi:hypothetical protein